MIIGLDFDNTIILYDTPVHEVALSMGLIPSTLAKDKIVVRDYIRQSAAGDEGWQKVQGQIYGKKIGLATLAEGFVQFAEEARKRGVTLKVVSHKTERGHFDDQHINLRTAALDWMTQKKFFSETAKGGLGFLKEDIFFEETRLGKINRLAELVQLFSPEKYNKVPIYSTK